MASPPAPLVSVAWLLRAVDEGSLRVLDCRWTLGVGPRADLYLRGHLPGAVFIDLEQALAGPPGAAGRHPLPHPALFQAAMRRAGVGPDTCVVAYDEGTGAAARCWWLLRAAGHAEAAVLDGGVAAWVEAGGPLVTSVSRPSPGGLTVTGFSGTVTADVVARLAAAAGSRRAAVLDARAPERYRGELEPVDPRAGHIPGSRNLSFGELFPAGRLLESDALAATLDAAGVDPSAPPVVYCGSGITACMVLLALAVAGVEGGRLYPGSWSEWSQDPAHPVAIGPDP